MSASVSKEGYVLRSASRTEIKVISVEGGDTCEGMGEKGMSTNSD